MGKHVVARRNWWRRKSPHPVTVSDILRKQRIAFRHPHSKFHNLPYAKRGAARAVFRARPERYTAFGYDGMFESALPV